METASNANYNRFIRLIRSIYKDLMLWYNFGVERDSFISHYDNGVYMHEADEGEGSIQDPDYIFEQSTFTDLTNTEIINKYGLRRVGNKLYSVHKISDNIYLDRDKFFSFLCCYDFTDSLASLLEYANGNRLVLFEDHALEVYNYSSYDYDNPIVSNKSLLPLLNANGVYIVQYKFVREAHAFVILKEEDRVTVINYYNELHVVTLTYQELLGTLWLIEQNDRDNRPLLSKLFGTDTLYYESDYHVISLIQCYYWPRTVNVRDYKNYLKDVVAPLFSGREEEYVLKSQYS